MEATIAEVNNKAVSLIINGNPKEAINLLNPLIDQDSNNAILHFNLALAYLKLQNYKNAFDEFLIASKLKEDFVEAHFNIGKLFMEAEKPLHAIAKFREVLKIDSNYWKAHSNMGTILSRVGDLEKALEAYDTAISLSEDTEAEVASALYITRHICDWEKVDHYKKRINLIKRKIDTSTAIEDPFMNIVGTEDLQENLNVARIWSNNLKRKVFSIKLSRPTQRSTKFSKTTRIKLGYVSDGFRDFPTGHNLISVLERHDPMKFEVVIFSHGEDDNSEWRSRAVSSVDKFVDIKALSTPDAARAIQKEKIDILVDLKGYTQNSRLEIFALTPAPIQVSFLGFPGTTGSDFINYLIADEVVVPLRDKKYFSEEVLYLPECYRPFDISTSVENGRFKKQYFGIPEKGTVLCSFNSNYKITRKMFETWLDILKANQKFFLLLLRGNEVSDNNLQSYANDYGVNAQRIIFLDRLSKREHLARLSLCDLALDTHPVNGHTTTMDALWAGLPVVTTYGKHFASRVSASCLHSIGLRDLVANDLENYKNLAIEIASSPKKLRKIKSRLSDARKKSLLFDMTQYTKNLESIYEEIFARMS